MRRSFSKNTELTVCYSSAGTGKTTFLTGLVEDAWYNQGIPLEKMGFLTFSRAGAEVIKERVGKVTGVGKNSAKLKNFCTIHSLAYRLNKEQGLAMMGDGDYEKFSEETGWPRGSLNWDEELRYVGLSLHNVPEICELYRNNRPMVQSMYASSVLTGDYLVAYMCDYTRWKRENKKVDFTDLLENVLRLEMDPMGIELLLLDEMQDSTLLQWEVLAHLFSDAKKVFIACDPKQALYRFTGAEPSVPQKLRAKVQILGKTYRLPRRVLQVSDGLARLVKTVDYYPSESVKDEEGVVDILNNLEDIVDVCLNDGQSVYLLAPSNHFLKKYVEVLQKNFIPYKIRGEDPLPFKLITAIKGYKEGDSKPVDVDEGVFDWWVTARDKGWDIGNITIDLRTIHQSKGLEADKVVLATDITNKMRVAYTHCEDDLHCMYYVGVTRAKHELYILSPQTNLHYAGIEVIYKEVLNAKNNS